jgi:hypothetical protein
MNLIFIDRVQQKQYNMRSMTEIHSDFDPQADVLESIYKETTDPAERVGKVTTANIIEPFRRNAEALGLSPEKLAELEQLAIKVGNLERMKVKDLLQKGLVFRIDSLLKELADTHPNNPEWQAKFVGSSSLRHGITEQNKTISDYAAKNPNKPLDEVYREWTTIPYFAVQSDLVRGADSQLAELVAKKLGVLPVDGQLSSLKNLKEWKVRNDGTSKGSLDKASTSLGEEVTVNIFERTDNGWDFYLRVSGQTAAEMLKAPLTSNPFEEQKQSSS